MIQAARTMTALNGALAHCRVLICDRDRKWSAPARHLLEESAVRVVQTPYPGAELRMHTPDGSYGLLRNPRLKARILCRLKST